MPERPIPTFPSATERRRLRKDALNLDGIYAAIRGIWAYAFSEGVAEAGSALLRDNPHILTDLEAEHAIHPNQLIMAIVPTFNLIFARYNDTLIAVKPTLPCTSNAISSLLGGHRRGTGGYALFRHSGGMSEELLIHIAHNDPTRSVFNYNYSDPLGYVAADVMGFIASDYDGNLSPRAELPVPPTLAIQRGS